MSNRKYPEQNKAKPNRLSRNSSESKEKNGQSPKKISRYGSLHSFQKQNANTPKKSKQKIYNHSHIKILLRNNSFIVEKKYLIYEIQCSLIKKQERESLPVKNSESNEKNENYLFINLQNNCFTVIRSGIKQNFYYEQENTLYVQVKICGYALLHVLIQNKKVQFVQLSGKENIDEQDLTIIEPLKLIQDGEQLRGAKIKNYMLCKEGKGRKKIMSFSWSLFSNQSNLNTELTSRNSIKRGEPKWSQLFNSYSINKQKERRVDDRKKKKKLNDSIDRLDNCCEKIKIIQSLKNKQINIISKNMCKISLNQSGLYLSGLVKKSSWKQNNYLQKWNTYGLQKIQMNKVIQKNLFQQLQLINNRKSTL